MQINNNMISNDVVLSISNTRPLRGIMILSTFQAICGFSTILITVFNAIYGRGYHDGQIFFGGIWSGLFFGASGILGIITSYKPSNCRVISMFVFSILTLLLAIGMIAKGTTVIVAESNYGHFDNFDVENILKKPYIHFYTSCVLVIIASVQLGLTIAILFFTFKVVKCIGKNFGEENTQTHFPRRRRRLQHQASPTKDWSKMQSKLDLAQIHSIHENHL